MAEPTKAPRNSRRCWPDDCRMYHIGVDELTQFEEADYLYAWPHLEGEDPCMCPCHMRKIPGDDTGDRQRAEAKRAG